MAIFILIQQQHYNTLVNLTTQDGSQAYTIIELLTPSGPEFRRVSTAPVRPPRDDEIPLIDPSGINGDLDARTAYQRLSYRSLSSTQINRTELPGVSFHLLRFEQRIETPVDWIQREKKHMPSSTMHDTILYTPPHLFYHLLTKTRPKATV